MENFINLIIINLSKIGIGVLLFLVAYLSNMGLGAWHNVKIEGHDFNWKLIGNSLIKYIILLFSLAGLCIVITAIPEYMKYVGMNIPDEYSIVVDNIVIVGAFIGGTLFYVKDGITKLNKIISNKTKSKTF